MQLNTVGFIGLGLMGRPMAKHILKARYSLVVFNRTKEKTDEFRRMGAAVCTTPKELARQCDIVISMVTAPEDAKDVLLGSDGVVQSKKGNLTVIDMSTIGPRAARALGEVLAREEMDFVDAPVTGGTYAAESGELTIFVGGKKASFERIKPLLLTMGKTIHYMGQTGAGQAMKLINNYLIATSMVALSEGMLFADLLGLPRKLVADVLMTVPATSPMMHKKIPNYVSGQYPVNFTLKNMNKDLTLAVEELTGSKKLLLLQRVQKLYETAVKHGFADEDYSAIVNSLA